MGKLIQFIPFLTAPSSPFEPPSFSYSLLTSPIQVLLIYVHGILVWLRGTPSACAPPPSSSPLRVVCISDTHTYKPSLPAGDLLIHAGDMTNAGTLSDIQAQVDWLGAQPFTHIVCIAGNHDSYFDPSSRRDEDIQSTRRLSFPRNVHYLQHGGVTLTFPLPSDTPGGRSSGEKQGAAGREEDGTKTRTLKVHGAPQIPACGGPEHAFQYARGADAWSGTLPADVDVLVTHTPPRWHLDLPVGLGCEFLGAEVARVRPRLHVFGHVHGGRGRKMVFWGRAQEAFERCRSRQKLWDWTSIQAWTDALLGVVLHGVLGVAWDRVWKAEAGAGEATVMVNAGMVDWRNRLVNEPQIVLL